MHASAGRRSLSLSGLLFFHPPLHPRNTRKWSHMLRRVEAGESRDVSQCLACRSSCPVTGLVPGAGSCSVPTNEAVRSHTKCGSDVCPHVDHYGESRYEHYLDIEIFTRCSRLERNKARRPNTNKCCYLHSTTPLGHSTVRTDLMFGAFGYVTGE